MTPKKWNNKPIGMPGVYSGMPLSFYHSAEVCIEPSISSSGLRVLFNDSPAHYWSQSPFNPNRVEREETKALSLGRAAHHLLFGEADFRSLFTLRPATINGEAWHGNKSICKGWLAQMKEAGLTVLTFEQMENIKRIAGELSKHPLVKAGILNGNIEHSMFAKDPATGVWLRARPDALPNDSLDFSDLKTCRSVKYNDLVRSIREFGYCVQAGMVSLLCRHLYKKPLNSFSLVFAESEPPNCVRVVTLKPADIELGEKQCLAGVAAFAQCWHNNHWPGPGGDQTDAAYIEIGDAERERIADRLKHGLT